MSQNEIYLGNPNLKKANTPINFTKKQVEEWIRCKEDPIYFTKNYVKIVSLDEGLVPFKMWDFQENLIRNFMKIDSIFADAKSWQVYLCILSFTLLCF